MEKWRIVKSIQRENKGFSIGLLIMFTIMIICVFFSSIFPNSIRKSLDDFTQDYRLADAWITTLPDADYPMKRLKKIDHVETIDASYSVDSDIKFNGIDNCSARIFTVSQGDKQEFYNYEKSGNEKFHYIGISQRFARLHSISVGDKISLKTPSGRKKVKVGSIISTPESMVCSRDELSKSDMYEFCYIYLSSKKVDKFFNIGDLKNRLTFYFDEGTTEHEMEKAIDRAEDILGESVLSSTIYSTSQFKSTIDSELDASSNTIYFMLRLIFLIGICFSAFFVYQVVAKERNTIGILLALGYSRIGIFGVFLRYVAGLALLGEIIGSAIGIVLVKYVANIYLVEFSLPSLSISYDLNRIILLLILYIFTVIFTCLVSSGNISRVDPCEAYGGYIQKDIKIPKGVANTKMPIFPKLAILSLYRKKWRTLAMSLCISACIVLLVMAISIKFSEQQAFPANFGKRYAYDMSLRIDGNHDTIKYIKKYKMTEEISNYIAFRKSIKFNNEKKTTQISTIERNSDLLSAYDSAGNRLNPEDGIILDSWFAEKIGATEGDYVKLGKYRLKVTGIADEYIDGTQYISKKTAKKCGHSKYNTTLVKLGENVDGAKALKHFKKDDGVYFGSLISGYEELCKDSFKAIGSIINIFVCLAVMLGSIIIYNMVTLSAHEKQREYAILLALGIWNKEIFEMAFIENINEYLLAIISAIPIGYYTSIGLMRLMGTEGHSFPTFHMKIAVLFACIISLIYIIVGVIETFRKVKKIDPAIALNYNE